MVQKSGTPGWGPAPSQDDVRSFDRLEYVMSSRLAGEALANALFIADAGLSEALKGSLPVNASRRINDARVAIARAARSGLVLLTATKPGCEPIDNVNLLERVALAANMLRRLMPSSPEIKIVKNPHEEVFARVPVGLPPRLLIRTLACLPNAQQIYIEHVKL